MEPTKKSAGRTPLLVVAIVVVAVGLAIFGFEQLFGRSVQVEATAPPEPAPVAAPAAAPGREEAVVVAVEGKVERKGADGRWSPVKVGETLGDDTALRTGPGSRADLKIGAAAKVTVTDRTELTVRELTSAVHRFSLTQGRITAAYDEAGERVVRIEGPNGTAVAEAKGARFNVLSTHQSLAVATQTGVVNLAAAGKAVAIHQGEQAIALAGQAPAAASPLSAEILLKIAKSRASAGANRCLFVEGLAEPGAEVTIDGAQVPLDADGRFTGTPLGFPGKSSPGWSRATCQVGCASRRCAARKRPSPSRTSR